MKKKKKSKAVYFRLILIYLKYIFAIWDMEFTKKSIIKIHISLPLAAKIFITFKYVSITGQDFPKEPYVINKLASALINIPYKYLHLYH